MCQPIDKQKVFFENISPNTTTDSLKAYLLEKYQIQSCTVPSESGKNKGHGIVVFFDEAEVDTLMENRPHIIDGAQVEIYRSVLNQGALKKKKGVKNLIVSGIKNKLTESHLKKYFKNYGKINYIDMNNQDNFCRIEFDDYDSVDKALLDKPHTIHNVEVELKKDDQLQTDFETSTEKLYSIHIKNIPSRYDANYLSQKFDWAIYNIVMQSSSNQQSLTECWFKDVDNQEMATVFIENWDGKLIAESRIKCELEEDKTDLCKYFQVGICKNNDDYCDWQHIKCAEYETCSASNCLYGHREGLKTNMTGGGSNSTYRIKITGFQRRLTRQLLALLLNYENENFCYVNPSHNHIGYIVKLKTFKFAKRLIQKWHNKEIEGGHKLKCQLELDTFLSTSYGRFNSISTRNDSRPCRTSSPSSDSSSKNSRDSSLSKNDNDFNIKKSVDRQSNNENESFGRISETLINHSVSNTERKRSSTESTTSSIDLKSQLPEEILGNNWEITKHIEGRDGQVKLIRGKTERKQLAVLKIYKNNNFKDYSKELKALQSLKDINNVSKLIEYSSNKFHSWIILERAPGYSLKEFIDRIYHNELRILETIQLSQQLLKIIKCIHSQGIFYRNLEPEHIMIEWDFKKTSIEQAQLTLINFSQAYIVSDKTDPANDLSKQCWYQPSQANVKGFQSNSTIDTSGICAILFWLITKIDPHYDNNKLPHQQDNARREMERKIIQEVKTANAPKRKPIDKEQLKLYLIDAFDTGFDCRDYEPSTINSLERRLESIQELLLPSNPNLMTTEAIFQELFSICNKSAPVLSMGTSIHQDIFEKASNAFYEAKKVFLETNPNQYSWSEGTCTWLNNAYSTNNERRHDDILTYHVLNRGTSSSYSIIITCLATVSNDGNTIKLSVGSPINGEMIQMPIGHYGKAENYMTEFKRKFINELDNLLKSILKQRKAIQ